MSHQFSRRGVLAGAGLAAAAIGTPMLSACSSTSDEGSVAVSSVPVGGALIQADGRYVVTQPTAGTFKAFTKTCPHAGCAVSKIHRDSVECTCHGTYFSLEDGSVISGPSAEGLAEVPVSLEGDSLLIG